MLLDDEESDMVFIDHPSVEMSVENSLSTYEPHGCVVVFSVVDRSSFRVAEEIINYLWQENYTKDKAVILVGNKADLARARLITSQGKSGGLNYDGLISFHYSPIHSCFPKRAKRWPPHAMPNLLRRLAAYSTTSMSCSSAY